MNFSTDNNFDTIDTIYQLRQIKVPVVGKIYKVNSTSAEYYYDPADSTSADNGSTVFIPYGTNFRLKLISAPSPSFKTIAELKANAKPIADTLFYLSESGKEGLWYYDPADTTTAENTGLCVVTTTGSLRLKRRLGSDLRVFKSWFSGSNIYFDSTSDANTTIPSTSRKRGMRVYVMVSGEMVDYWYRDGITDPDLVGFAQTNIANGDDDGGERQTLVSSPSPGLITVAALKLFGSGGIDVTPVVGSDFVEYNINGSSSGTQAGRPSSPVLGEPYYKTDLLEGKEHYDGLNWATNLDTNTVLYTDFFGNNNALPVSGNVSGVGAQHGQSIARFSHWRCETGTDSNGIAQLRTNSTIALQTLSGKVILWYKGVLVNALSDGTDRYILRIGRPAGADGVGIFFKYTDNVNGGRFQCICHDGTTATTVDSGISFTANTEYEFLIDYNLSGTDSAKFYINNNPTPVANITTNLATVFTSGYFGSTSIEKTLGSNNRYYEIDKQMIKRIL